MSMVPKAHITSAALLVWIIPLALAGYSVAYPVFPDLAAGILRPVLFAAAVVAGILCS